MAFHILTSWVIDDISFNNNSNNLFSVLIKKINKAPFCRIYSQETFLRFYINKYCLKYIPLIFLVSIFVKAIILPWIYFPREKKIFPRLELNLRT